MNSSAAQKFEDSRLPVALFLSFFAVWVGAFAAVSWSVTKSAHGSLGALLVTVLFNALAVVLSLLALGGWLEFLRFRTSYLLLDAPFDACGGELTGIVQVRLRHPQPSLSFQVCLRCRSNGLGKKQRTLWQDERNVDSSGWRVSGRDVLVPFAFTLPPGHGAHAAVGEGAPIWSVVVSAQGHSFKYESSFSLAPALAAP